MKISVLGAGAIGAMFGGLLKWHAPELQVVLIGRGKHGERMAQEQAVTLSGPWGTHRQPIEASLDPTAAAGSHIIFLTVKSQATTEAIQSLGKHLGGALVASIQNGINDYQLQALLPAEQIVMGMTSTNMVLTEPAHVAMHLDGLTLLGPVAGSPLHGGVNEVAKVLSRIQVPGLTFGVHPNVFGIRYNKLSINALGYASSMSASNFITEALCHRGWRKAVGWPIVRECRRVFAVAGITLEPIPGRSDLTRIEKLLRRLDTPLLGSVIAGGAKLAYSRKPIIFSLQQDLSQGKATEVEHINGELVRLASAHGTAAPYNELVVQMVHELESRPQQGFFSREEVIERFSRVTS